MVGFQWELELVVAHFDPSLNVELLLRENRKKINDIFLRFNSERDKSVKKRIFRCSGATDCNKTSSNLRWTGNSVHL
jgi:hypothetical protein